MSKNSPHWLWHIISFFKGLGVSHGDSDEERIKKNIAINLALFGGVGTQLFLGALFLRYDQNAGGWLLIMSGIFLLSSVVAYCILRRQFFLFSQSWWAVALLSPFLSSFLNGGIRLSGFGNIWSLSAPLLSLTTSSPKQSLPWFVGFIVTIVISFAVEPFMAAANNLPPSVLTFLYLYNAVGASFLIFFSAYIFVKQRDIAFTLLSTEKRKSEHLLLNILPKDIAEKLKDKEETIADHYDGVSVLFADIVNFTPLSAKMTPGELVSLLNEVFTRFDSLVDRYGLEKIKTIGDCYMVASGVPKVRDDHAHAITNMALDMQNMVATEEFRGQKLAFRIGINSGPAVAGVIGEKKFIYDMWGDTVNTASRMESHGSSGVIQITESTYDLVKDAFLCIPKGLIDVKGIGKMKVWHVQGKIKV